ncbi:hypothetical protein DTO164E3_4746 [Paecilomyces variotii]|nr:hypothetical protein DTO164E3_4746 [Paecilomyces variotii]
MYQYQLSQAESIVMGMIQTESPYFQPSPKAPGPFTAGLFSNDPTFEECDANSASCAMAWALRIIDSVTVYSLGSGLYSWFSDYTQDCLNTDNCQSRIMQIEQSSDTWLYNIVTKGTVEMVTPVNENATLASANQNGYMSSILAWVRAHNATIGQRIFEGFQLYDPSDLEGLTAPCVTALTRIIKCDSYLLKFQEAFYHGSLGNDTLADSVCDKSCGASLQEWFDTVSMSCAGQNVTGAVPTKLGGIVYQGYNETCLKDPGSGKYCNDIISGFTLVADINQMPKDEMCSYYYTTKLQMMQSSPYSAYNTDSQGDLQLVHSTCAISGSTDLPPSLIIREPDAPTMCVSGNTYTIKDGDTCDSIASNYGVASAALFMANSDIIVNCSSPATNTTLCLLAALSTLSRALTIARQSSPLRALVTANSEPTTLGSTPIALIFRSPASFTGECSAWIHKLGPSRPLLQFQG